jgi:hypothetical protein
VLRREIRLCEALLAQEGRQLLDVVIVEIVAARVTKQLVLGVRRHLVVQAEVALLTSAPPLT